MPWIFLFRVKTVGYRPPSGLLEQLYVLQQPYNWNKCRRWSQEFSLRVSLGHTTHRVEYTTKKKNKSSNMIEAWKWIFFLSLSLKNTLKKRKLSQNIFINYRNLIKGMPSYIWQLCVPLLEGNRTCSLMDDRTSSHLQIRHPTFPLVSWEKMSRV